MDLISPDYLREQEKLHERPGYGVMGRVYGPLVRKLVTQAGATQVLDYGAGKQSLKPYLYPGMKYSAYDPAVPAISAPPQPTQFVACIDVLEHIEPDKLDAILDDLKRLALGALFATVHCGPAVKHLSDGRNAHLIQQPMQWWLPKFWERFEIQIVTRDEHGFWTVCYP
jgi:hypothetical protein